jgi:hypothetical protein
MSTTLSDLSLVKTLRRGDTKGQVRLVQEWLCLHGEHVSVDGDFGPATESAVSEFQRKRGIIPPTGIVDATTFDHLVRPMHAALAPIPANGRSLGEMVVAYAQQHLAQHPLEIGGQNKGPWVRLYMSGNEGTPWAWCAGFACFCLKQACEVVGQPVPIATSFSCDSLASSGKSKGRFGSHSMAGPGSFFLVRNTPTDWIHTGIVVSTGAETCRTIEGNTNDDGSREGYEVCARTRGYGKLDFIQI